ncbi:hypothetical protein RB195_011854 [Necator americanus]|uniref:Uncharacterized protein n=1 Tax=Necator americanus TaxID=51031 RepID=A0ABR1D4A1_NECAM
MESLITIVWWSNSAQLRLDATLNDSWIARDEAPGRKRKFWTDVVKENLRKLGVDRRFRRDVRFRRIWNSDEWIDSVQALAEDREGPVELCSRTTHFGEDAVIALCADISPPIKSKKIPFSPPYISDSKSRAVRKCLRKAVLENDVRVVEIPPANLKGQLVRNGAYDRLCTTPSYVVCPSGREGDYMVSGVVSYYVAACAVTII